MKKLILFLLIIGCASVYAQRKPKIKGNKSVIEVSEELPDFNRIELKDDLEIFLKKSIDPGYSITADDNLIDVLKFEVVDSTLFISSFYQITGKKALGITIHFTELVEVVLHDGHIFSNDLISSDVFTLHSYGFSRTELQLSTSLARIELVGNSKSTLNIDSEQSEMLLKDKAQAEIYSNGHNNALELNDDSLAQFEGTVDSLQIRMTGTTKLRASKMESNTVEANISEGSNARVRAMEKLELDSSGTAKLFLFGDPEIEIRQFLDSSELHKQSE